MQASSSQEPLLEYALLLRCHLTDSMAIAGAGDSQTGPLSSAVVSTTVLTSMSAGSSSCNKSVEHTVFEKGGRSDSGVDLSVEDTVLGVNGALHGALIDSFVAERLLKQHQRRRSVERLRSLARSPPEGLASLPSRLSSLCRSYVELSAANVRIPQDTTSGSRATVEDVFSNQSWVQPTCDEGLFIQVPSVGFIQECRKSLVDSPLAGDFTFPDGTTYSDCQSNGPDGSYSSEKASSTRQPSMDVVQYNARNKTTLDVSSGRPKRDDGYLYGYGHVLLGLPAKSSDDSALETGVVLCLLSSSPEFNLLRSIALGIIPSLSVAAEEGGDALLGYQLRNLIPLLRPPNSHGACSPKPGDLFKISSGKWEFSFLRPHVQFYPFLNSPLSLLLASFSVDALRLLQTLLLTEERVIIIGSSAQHVSACVVSALSMIVPLSWCGPLVPYLSPPQAEGCGLLDHLLSEVDTDMFLVGSTSDIIAPVILRTCNRYTARIWFADARTGYLGTSPPREYRHHGSAEKVKLQQRQQVELLPASEKVKKAIIGLTSDTQRTQFRAHMNAVASRESRLKAEVNDWVQAQQSGSLQLLLETMKLSDASSLASTGAAVNSGSCVAPPFLRDVTEETVSIVHGAFLEYNVQRIVGSYRKCIPPNELMAATSRRKLLKLSPQDFLVGTVGATLAEEVYHTRLFRRFERSVCKMEALGLLSALSGEAVKANSSQPLSPSNGPSVAFVMGPQWLSVMHVFFNRAICRFPELFPEIDPSLCRQLYARNVLMPAGLSYCPLALQRVGGWDGSAASSRGNGGGGGGGGGGGMKRFFTKVKQSFATGGSSQTIAAEPFIRCACAMGGTVSAAAVSSSMDLEGEADDPQAALSRVEDRRRRQLLLLQSTYSLPDSHRDALAVGSDGKAIPPSSVGATIRLTMDAVHSFETYHRRLAPIAVKAKATAVQRRAKQEIRAALTWHFIRLAMNFPTLYKLWMEAEDRQSSMLINDTTTDIARPKVEHTQPRYADLTEEHCTTIQIQPAPVIPTRTAPREMDLLDSLFHQSPPPRVPPRTPKHASTSSTGSNGAERAATSWERMAPHSSRSAPSSAPVVEADQWSSGRPQNFSPQATSSPTNADSRRGGNAETSSNAASLSSFGSQRREPYRSTDQHADPWKGFSTGVPENYPK